MVFSELIKYVSTWKGSTVNYFCWQRTRWNRRRKLVLCPSVFVNNIQDDFKMMSSKFKTAFQFHFWVLSSTICSTTRSNYLHKDLVLIFNEENHLCKTSSIVVVLLVKYRVYFSSGVFYGVLYDSLPRRNLFVLFQRRMNLCISRD